jgi:hypothetical protein
MIPRVSAAETVLTIDRLAQNVVLQPEDLALPFNMLQELRDEWIRAVAVPLAIHKLSEEMQGYHTADVTLDQAQMTVNVCFRKATLSFPPIVDTGK